MAALTMYWLTSSLAQFDDLKQRATAPAKREQLIDVHDEIALAFRSLEQAMAKGELMYRTRKAGGEVRHWMHRFISIWYVVYPAEQVGWILRFQPVPSSWPD